VSGASVVIEDTVPYRGLPVGCHYCVYELQETPREKFCPKVPDAEYVVSLRSGQRSFVRELCASHAKKGTWR
jgi:hypothetical protein